MPFSLVGGSGFIGDSKGDSNGMFLLRTDVAELGF